MAELGLERHHAVSHSELTSGHDVTQLLSQINQNFKQSKADQILRLLQDQDKLTTDNTTDSVADDTELLREYDQIKEERVICDSDTLTDSSSDSGETDVTLNIQETETINSRHMNYQNSTNMQENKTDVNENREIRGFRRHRARTSFGFHNDMKDGPNDENVNFDTRDLSIRPKSSYVRRHQFRKRDESDRGGGHAENDATEPPPQRPSKSARPKSRLGRSSVPKSERKIIMMEADVVTEPETVAPTKDELVKGGANNITYDRFASTRQPKRESKRTKAFCDSNSVSQQLTADNCILDSSAIYMDIRDDVTEVQTIAPNSSINNSRNQHISSFTNNPVPRNSPVQTHVQHVQKRPINSHTRQEQVHNSSYYQTNTSVPNESHLMRTDTMMSNATIRSERPDNISPTSQIPLKRNNSNLTYARPKNPEPVTTRPIERPDIRPSTRTRRLHRRYMAPTQSHISQVRPTSESVILARQKTEKNLMKKQAENRPHSEKIINSQNKNIDLNLNPTQGPQTYVTSKGGVTQASHVQDGGFRGYDPSSRLKSSTQARDLPSDLTLPRRGQNNVVMGGRQSLAALMKLPPLEASLAAKKKERGLTLAARETCV